MPAVTAFTCGRSRIATRVVVGQFFAGAHLFRGTAESERLEVEGKDHIGTDAADDLPDVFVEPAPDRRDADHDGDANHDAEHGQRRAQLIAADRVRRHANDFTEFVFAHHRDSATGFRYLASGRHFQSAGLQTSFELPVFLESREPKTSATFQTSTPQSDPAAPLCARDRLRRTLPRWPRPAIPRPRPTA